MKEVKLEVFVMGGDWDPRRDGYPMLSFQKFWKSLKNDVMDFLNKCLYYIIGV